MDLTVVGSGNAVPHPDRVCAGFFLDHGGTRVLLDCGPGVVHHLARFGLPWTELDHLAISHFHTDHIGDIPMLLFALKHGTSTPRTAPLSIWGPPGTRDRLRRLAAAFGDHVTDPGFPLRVRELEPAGAVELGGLELRAHPTPHTPESVAYRVDAAGGSVAYTGDTGRSEEVAEFMAGADLMIAECSVPDDAPIDGHLTPSSLAAMARVAAPATLLITHVYPRLESIDIPAALAAAGWDGRSIRARDGLRLAVGGSGSPAPR